MPVGGREQRMAGRRLSRRRLALALLLLAWPGPPRHGAGHWEPQRASRNLMGTRVDIVADGGDARELQAAMEPAFGGCSALKPC
jgi:thiamine biosynthesis lipoprotein